MPYLRSAVAAFALFVPLLAGLWLVWFAVLVGLLGTAWNRLGGAAEALGVALHAFAVLSGLALYFALLWRWLGRMGIPPEARSWHLATTGLLPIVATVACLAIVVSSLRLGF